MSINNVNEYSSSSNTLYADYKFLEDNSNSNSSDGNIFDHSRTRAIAPTNADGVYTRAYYIPLNSVRASVNYTEDSLNKTLFTIEENLLRKLFVDPNISPSLEEAHLKIWSELSKIIFSNDQEEPIFKILPIVIDDLAELDANPGQKNIEYKVNAEDSISQPEPLTLSDINKDTPPSYICFDELLFAEKSGSTAARKLISEYNSAISQSTFSYLFQFRKLIQLFIHELSCIKYSLITDFGDQYENESQQQVAIHYDTWAKMVLHYTGRIAKTVGAQIEKLPVSEVDKIAKKQAAQFQAFFAVRLNAVDSEINDLLDNLKRDMSDNCEVFYSRYLSPSLIMTKDISDPLELDFLSTNFVKDFPKLAGELVVATNTLKGNFISIHADLIERIDMMTVRVDALFNLVHEKKKYANYITQLSNVSVKKQQILITVDIDLFSQFFRSAPIDSSRNNILKSSHADLDGLEENSHPQYLMKSGGTITGDIYVESNARIDGVSISRHSHSGSDGSAKISIQDIDFSNKEKIVNESVIKPLSIAIEGFISDILNGGIPVYDAIVSIEVSDEVGSNYNYELVYTELD